MNIMVVTLVFCLSGVAFAENKVVKFNLKTALDIALKSNISIKLQDQKIKIAQDKYYDAYNLSTSVKYIHAGFESYDSDEIELRKQELLYPLARQHELNYLKNDRKDLENNIKIDVSNNYYQLVIYDKQIELQTKAIEELKKEIEIGKTKMDLGKITSSDLKSLEYNLQQEEFKLEQIKRTRLKTVMSLNVLLGYGLSNEIRPLDSTAPEPEFKIDINDTELDELVAKNQEKSMSVIKQKDILEESKINLEIIKKNTNNEKYPGKDTLEYAISNSQYNINSAKIDVENSIRKAYNDLLNLKDDVDITLIKKEIANRDMEMASKKYSLGIIRYEELINKKTQMDNAEISLMKSKLNLYLQSVRFSRYMGE